MSFPAIRDCVPARADFLRRALLAIYYLKLWYRAYHRSTGSSYPWMARYWWASLLWEWVGLYFIELYAWVTIFRDGWFEIDDDITLVD